MNEMNNSPPIMDMTHHKHLRDVNVFADFPFVGLVGAQIIPTCKKSNIFFNFKCNN